MSNYFIRIESLMGSNNFQKLQKATVAIVGIGGVGGMAAIALARSGINKIIIQDFDVVDESNFNRQVVANIDTIGKPKVFVLEEMIKKINPSCQVISLNEKFDINSSLFNYEFSYLIDAIDNIENKFLLINKCLEKNINFISSMGTAKKLDISKLAIVDINKTSYDPIAKIIRRKMRENNLNSHFKVLSSIEEPIKGEILGSYMPVTSTAGLMLADYIIKEILRNEEM